MGLGAWGSALVLGDAAARLGSWRRCCLARAHGTCCSLWFPARALETGRVPEQRALLPPRLTDQSPGQKPQPALRWLHGRMQEQPRVPELLPEHLPCVWNTLPTRALAAGHRALPEGMAAPSPGLASMPGSQNRPPDLTASSAQDSLAAGPELRSLDSGADQACVGTTPWVSSTCDTVYSGGAVPRVWPLPPGQLDAEMQLEGVPHSWPWALWPLRPQLSPAWPAGRARSAGCGTRLLLWDRVSSPGPRAHTTALQSRPPRALRAEGSRPRCPPRPWLLCRGERSAGLDRGQP